MAGWVANRKKGRKGRPSDVFFLLFSKISGAEMNGFQSRKAGRDLQKPIPGCMGRIVNILDLNAGMDGRKMLTDRATRNGSPVSRSQPGVSKKVVDPVALQIEDKPVTYELKTCSSKKGSSGTPMKMLIAQEMLKGAETKQKPPSVVAKLMGLDALPVQQPGPTAERSSHERYKHSVYRHDIYPSELSPTVHCYGEQEHRYCDKTSQHDVHPSQCFLHEQKEFKDVYEIWPQPSRANHKNHRSLSKSHNEETNENRMALVRQKFMEAKRLATDQRLLQTKEFQDALEVLNSNKDLFLKFLEEPSSLFSKHLQELRTGPASLRTKCITVLKPSNAVRYNSGTEMRKQQALENEQVHNNRLSWSPGFVQPKADNLCQPTRIVVLKPSPQKLQDLKSSVNSPTSCRGLLKGRDCFDESGTNETRGSREAAKDITLKMRQSLSGSQMDETLFSSVLSHGYVGDESSFNRSDNEFMDVDDGNFSDSEIVTPTSRHAWDYVYRLGSPYSCSSLSQTSYSPDSSVIREAKKRLSERWAMVASHGTSQEQKLDHKSSSTLGEMLAISEMNKGDGNEVEQDVRLPAACLSSTRNEAESAGAGTPRNLLRSKSVPVSSSVYDNIELNIEVLDSQVAKSTASKDFNRSKTGKLSLKGKVSSLFFSKNKRSSGEKTASPPLVGTPDRVQFANLDYIGKRDGNFPLCTPEDVVGPSQSSMEQMCEIPSLPPPSNDSAKEVTLSTKATSASETATESQEQPSPISVLDAHFEDDVNSSSCRSSEGPNLECCQAISRSTPIESVARSLAWDEAQAGTSPSKLSKILSEQYEDDEQYSFVKALLSSAGFSDENFSSVLARWHSPDSPLDPLLLDKFLEHKDEEAKCRERRSNQRLLFDCVNAALLEVSWTNFWDRSRAKFRKSCISHSAMLDDVSVTEEVWGCMKGWFQGKVKQATYPGESISLVVDRVLRKEVAERGWAEMMTLEMEEIGRDIQGDLLEELVEDALGDLIPKWF